MSANIVNQTCFLDGIGYNLICLIDCTHFTMQFYKNLSTQLKDVVWKTEDDMQESNKGWFSLKCWNTYLHKVICHVFCMPCFFPYHGENCWWLMFDFLHPVFQSNTFFPQLLYPLVFHCKSGTTGGFCVFHIIYRKRNKLSWEYWISSFPFIPIWKYFVSVFACASTPEMDFCNSRSFPWIGSQQLEEGFPPQNCLVSWNQLPNICEVVKTTHSW